MRIYKKISQLERELNAEVVVQEEQSHEEIYMPNTTGDYASRWWSSKEEKAVDKPAVTEPDIETRARALIKLICLKQKLWFFQYRARRKIGALIKRPLSQEQKELTLTNYDIKNLVRGLNAEIVVEEYDEEVLTQQGIEAQHDSYWSSRGLVSPDETYETVHRQITVSDTQKREESKRALEELYEKTKYVTAKRRIEGVLGYKPGEKK